MTPGSNVARLFIYFYVRGYLFNLKDDGADLMIEVKITWFGHAMFSVENPRLKLVIDPFSENLGYPLPDIEADIVLVSHEHSGHNNTENVKRKKHVVKGDVTVFFNNTKIEGCSSFHYEQFGTIKGNNTMYKWNMSGLTLVHMGDFGQSDFDEEQAEFVRGASVLMIPIGGEHTIGAQKAHTIIKKVNPPIAIPMHYKIPFNHLNSSELSDFLAETDCFRYCSSSVSVSALSLPQKTEVWVLEPHGYGSH